MTEGVDQMVELVPRVAGAARSELSAQELLDELIDQHAPSMYRVARSIVHDASLAEDVVQESLVKAWQAAATFRGDASLR